MVSGLYKNYRVLVLLLCSTWLVLLFFKLPRLIWHSGVLLAWFTSQGLVMYKDFLNFYFPLSTYFVLPFFILFNWNLNVEPVLDLSIALLTLLFLYKISKKTLSFLGTVISLFFFSFLFFYFTTAVQYTGEALVGLLITILLYRGLSYSNSNRKYFNALVNGSLAAIILLVNQISAAALAVVSLFALRNALIKESRSNIFRLIFVFLTSLVIPLFATVFYFSKMNAFTDLLQNNFTYYLNYVTLARESSKLDTLPWNEILFFYLPTILATSLFFLTKKGKGKSLLIFLFFATVVTFPSVVFSVFHRHHFLYVLPLSSLLAGLVHDHLHQLKSRVFKISAVIIGIITTLQMSSVVLPWYFEKITTDKTSQIANGINPNDNEYEVLLWLKDNTNESDKILVAGDGLLYFEAQRLPSSKYFSVLPWHYKPLYLAVDSIRNNRPDYWIINTPYLERLSSTGGWNSPEISKAIQEELKSCYLPASVFPDWEIWQKSCEQ